MPDSDGIRIDPARLQHRIDALGRIGADERGALFRPAYGKAWLEARDRVEGWMRELGIETRVDAVGNLIGRLGGRTDGPVVMTGSHIDTVRDGGKYDGALGVHAALSAVEAIIAAGRVPDRPIEVIALCEEEGSRFDGNFIGSRAICGQLAEDELETLRDSDGVSLAEAMSRVGLDPGRVGEARRHDLAAFVELHIEQGGILDQAGETIGFVEAITGLEHLLVTVGGTQNHAGTTPMDLRRDALAGAARAIVEIERLATELGRPAVATVGQVEASPGARNVIPGKAVFSVDLRDPDPARLERLSGGVTRIVEEVGRSRGLDVSIERLTAHPPVPMSETVGRAVKDSAAALGLRGLDMVSGAGHDSMVFAGTVPTGMIFTPSRAGISHSPLEFTPIEQIVPATTVLAHTLLTLASDERPR